MCAGSGLRRGVSSSSGSAFISGQSNLRRATGMESSTPRLGM